MKDCRECFHSMLIRGKLLCIAERLPKPVEYMRDDRSACGMKAELFEPKDQRKYSEYDD